MLSNLQFVLFFIYSIIKYFKKLFIYCFAINSIVVYYITIISNILNKIAIFIKLEIVKDWLTQIGVNRLMLLKYYLSFIYSIQSVVYIIKYFIVM